MKINYADSYISYLLSNIEPDVYIDRTIRINFVLLSIV